MNLELTPLRARVLAVALAIAALSLVTAAIALPMISLHKRYDDLIEQRLGQLGRYHYVMRLRPSIEETARSIDARNQGSHYLKGATPTLAAAELQGALTRIIEGRQGRIMSSEILSASVKTDAGGPQNIAVSFQFGASSLQLQSILHAMETHEPYLFIDHLNVRANQGRIAPQSPDTLPEHLVHLTAHAYARLRGANP